MIKNDFIKVNSNITTVIKETGELVRVFYIYNKNSINDGLCRVMRTNGKTGLYYKNDLEWTK